MTQYIMALDSGTTSNRCILFDRQGTVRAMAQKELSQHFPQPGWVEHDPIEIWTSLLDVAAQALKQAGADHRSIAAIGITNQRETVVVWNKHTGQPICPAIVWQCRRTARYCDRLKEMGLGNSLREKTGLVLDAYFSATKLHWILEHIPGARRQAEQGELLFGTIDTWLIWRLTGGQAHVTDYSNASRTQLFNIHTLTWDEDILRLLNIPACLLPQVKPSSCVYGCTDPAFFGGHIPIAGVAGDQQAALFGQTCFSPGQVKNTYGTGCFLLMNTGRTPVFSKSGLVTSIAWGLDGRVEYALEGSIFAAGSAVQWLRDELGLISTAAESERVALSVPNCGGCYVVPAFTGLGAPHWDQYARGTILGLSRGIGRGHIVRATLEAIAHQTCDVLRAMEADAGVSLQTLSVDGGASANSFLMQTQADLAGCTVERSACVETTALGCAYLAGLAVGYWSGKDEIAKNRAVERVFSPAISPQERQARLFGWSRAVARSLSWALE